MSMCVHVDNSLTKRLNAQSAWDLVQISWWTGLLWTRMIVMGLIWRIPSTRWITAMTLMSTTTVQNRLLHT